VQLELFYTQNCITEGGETEEGRPKRGRSVASSSWGVRDYVSNLEGDLERGRSAGVGRRTILKKNIRKNLRARANRTKRGILTKQTSFQNLIRDAAGMEKRKQNSKKGKA